jgi:competence protein ComEC
MFHHHRLPIRTLATSLQLALQQDTQTIHIVQTAVTRGQFAGFMSRAIDAADTDPVPEGPALFVDFLNVGQGDAILLGFPNSQTMLVDAGRSDDAIKEAVSGFGPGFTVDTFVATHPDADHIGGADAVIKDFGVKTVIDSGQDHTTQTYLDYLAAIQASGASFKIAQEGQDISPDLSVTVKVLHVDSEAADLNEGSIVLMVSYEETDYLLTGDAGVEVEKELMAKYDLGAEVLKVSHHGSSTGTSEAFLAAVNPTDAIVSYGEGNPYGHPHSEVLNRLLDYDIEAWETPEGDIETWTDGQDIYFTQGIDGEPTQDEPVTDSDTIVISNKDLSGETVGIQNSGSKNIDMKGWTLVSFKGNQTYTFPDGFILGAGRTVYVTSGPNAKEQLPAYLQWTTANMWANTGDPAILYNSAGEIASFMN